MSARTLLGYDGGSGCETRAAYFTNGDTINVVCWGSTKAVRPDAAVENLREMLPLSESRDARAIQDLISNIMKAYPGVTK